MSAVHISATPGQVFAPVTLLKRQTVTDAVIARVQEMCRQFLNPDKLLLVAEEAIKHTQEESVTEREAQSVQTRIDSLTAHLDQMYTDRLSGLLPEEDFQRILVGSRQRGIGWRKSGRSCNCAKKAQSTMRIGPENWYDSLLQPPVKAVKCW